MTGPAADGVTRHFATIGDAQVHYRRAGSGAPVVLLHRAPLSSADLLPLLQSLPDGLCAIAPDLPGYGASSALAGPPGIEGYARVILALIDALGIGRCQIYGEQLGAVVAACAAHRKPDLIAGVLLADQRQLEEQDVPPPFEPSFDGAHLSTLWAYLRDDACFAPWSAKHLAARRLQALPSPAELQSRLIQIISAPRQGRDYRAGFTAALNYRLPGTVEGAAHNVTSVDGAGALNTALTSWLPQAGCSATPPPPATSLLPGQLASRMIDVPGGQLHGRLNLDAGTVPLLIQHDAASSTGTVEPIVTALIGRRSVIALDLPGSGLSDNLIGAGYNASVADYADYVIQALDALGLEQVDFYGMWGGGFVGCELALRHPSRVRRLVMSNLFFHEGDELVRFQRNYTPDVSPVWHGGHLLQCWHQMRDQGLFFPWFDTSAEGVIRREPFLATDMVHERVCSLLKAGTMYRTAYQAHFVYPVFERVSALTVPTLLATSEWDPNRPHTEAVARASPNCRFQMLDADFTQWGVSFLPFLEARDDGGDKRRLDRKQSPQPGLVERRPSR